MFKLYESFGAYFTFYGRKFDFTKARDHAIFLHLRHGFNSFEQKRLNTMRQLMPSVPIERINIG